MPETYRQERKRIEPSEISNTPPVNTYEQVQNFHKAMNLDSPDAPMGAPEVKGNVPLELQRMLKDRMQSEPSQPAPDQKQPAMSVSNTGNSALDELLAGVQNLHNYEPVSLPSGGFFYDSSRLPEDGIVHVRPMTGKEEQYLATQRFSKGNTATDMILKACIKENIDVSKLLIEDRIYLLIFLRGISYGNLYDVSMKCQSCGESFEHSVDLNSLEVNRCSDSSFADGLIDTLPVSGYKFKYRMATGSDDVEVSEYRQRRSKQFPDSLDDTFFHRASLLVDWIGNGDKVISERSAIKALLPQMPVADINHLRNVLNDSPFGVDTKVTITCPRCFDTFVAGVPMEIGFFFPRNKKEEKPL